MTSSLHKLMVLSVSHLITYPYNGKSLSSRQMKLAECVLAWYTATPASRFCGWLTQYICS